MAKLSRRSLLQSASAIGTLLRARVGFPLLGNMIGSSQIKEVVQPAWQNLSKANRIQPVVAISEGIPVSGFGSVDILSLSPDLSPNDILQKANATPNKEVSA